MEREDGWELEFNAGRIARLTTDTNEIINWTYNGSLVTGISDGSAIPQLEVLYDRGGIVTCVKINGDTYNITLANNTLTEIGYPDGTNLDFTQSNTTAWDGRAATAMTVTDRYGVSNTYTFIPETGELMSDGVWNYETLSRGILS